jgi:DNA repair exonuclease SbcCD nuclease subunit
LRVAHISDTHIRNYKYHTEYRAVFDQIYERLRKEKPDCIVHCGDLAHTKTQLSPEYFDLATSFLKNLADIAPVYIILGNHDGNLKNTSRQDAITPIANALDHPNLHLLKNAGEVPLNDDITFNVLL